jgi:tRNA threonylcarbamoyladenosine biosynthesis protein TsaB
MSLPSRFQGPWLAIDTATDIASVAVRAAHGMVARSIRGARQHAAQLLPLVHEVLSLGNVSLNDLQGIVVGDGPGSFTGLRIGWAAAKGLAHERQLPLLTMPSLLGAAHAAGAGTVAACYDALRGQVFCAVYSFTDDDVEAWVRPGLCTIAELSALPEPEVAVGDGAVRYRDAIAAWTGRAPIGLEALPPVAGSFLALLEFDESRVAVDRLMAEPAYGRAAEAQVKWENRHGRPLENPPSDAE